MEHQTHIWEVMVLLDYVTLNLLAVVAIPYFFCFYRDLLLFIRQHSL